MKVFHSGLIGLVTIILSLWAHQAAALPSYEVLAGGDGLNCSANGEGLPPNQVSSSPGAEINHSNNVGSEFEAWFGQANQQSLKTRTRASQGGFNESPLRSCAGTAAILKIDDLIFSSDTEDPVDVSLSIHYEGVLKAGIEGGNAAAGAKLFNLVTLAGEGDENGNSSGLEILNQSNDGLFEVNCGFSGCFNEDNTELSDAGLHTGNDAQVIVDVVLTHLWTQVPVNTLIDLTLGINSTSSVLKNFNDGGFGESNFANTVTFANPTAVFTLANGVTANSEQLGLTNNSFGTELPVPEPAALVLFGIGLVGIRLVARKHAHI